MRRWIIRCMGIGMTALTAHQARSDEGMWLFNEPPTELLRDKHDFVLSPQWLDRAQGASIRFNNGGSGSFISPDGLIITNHHIGSDALQKLSTKEKPLLQDGFLAKTRAEELKCPDLELNVLQDILDVTDRVNAGVKPGLSPADAAAARKAAMANIEKLSTDETKLRSDVVTLYQGGMYHLYRYKKYTDVRLVMAPEGTIAAFGGDVDNFEFPRFNLDICFFRAYEDGKPAKPKHWFKFSKTGPKEGDLVFVTGHPGTTNRMETLEKVKHRRDHTLPYEMSRLRAMEAALLQYGAKGPDEARMAENDLHRVANRRKASAGMLSGLLLPKLLEEKAKKEEGMALDMLSAGDAEGGKRYEAAVAKVAGAQKEFAKFEREYFLLERGDAFASDLFTIARHLVRYAEEDPKPSGERLREYRESNMESLKLSLFSPAPIHKDLEAAKLTASLTFLAEQMGGETPAVRKALGDQNPERMAAKLAGSKLADVSYRRNLFDGGKRAIEVSNDPMIDLALAVDGLARTMRGLYEEEYEEPERQAFAELAKLRFAAQGKNMAPDATFTLRLAFGVVKGYMGDSEFVPFQTTFGGAFEKAEKLKNREPFNLPKRWIDGKAKLDLKAPFNFVSTADTIGGNSGSPVLNREGEFVGINFDRNRFGLSRNFVYSDEQARHISVHSKGILEALTKLYDCPDLVKELTGGM